MKKEIAQNSGSAQYLVTVRCAKESMVFIEAIYSTYGFHVPRNAITEATGKTIKELLNSYATCLITRFEKTTSTLAKNIPIVGILYPGSSADYQRFKPINTINFVSLTQCPRTSKTNELCLK